jgi:hypothetical protein
MNFDPYNLLLKIQKIIRSLIFNVGVHLGVWGSFFHNFLHSQEYKMWPLGFTLGSHFRKALAWLWTQG